jgi:hypothetical protein
MDRADKVPRRRLSIADAVSATSSTPAIGPTRRRIVVAQVCLGEGEAGVRLDQSERPSLMVAFDVHLTCRPLDPSETVHGIIGGYFSY